MSLPDYTSRVCIIVFLLSALLVLDADAQRRKDRHRIRVMPEGETCLYQIRDQTNQDLLVISPGGLVTIQARRGLWVDVFVEDDARGVPGTRNRRTLALRAQAPRDTLVARTAVGRSTEHQLKIQCCMSRDRGPTCPRWTDAQPHPTDDERRNGTSSAFLPSDPVARGPSAPMSGDRPPSSPPGGPVMRVEEEQ